MAEKTTTTEKKEDSRGNESEKTTQTERNNPANPQTPDWGTGSTDTAKRGPGSDTNPSGLGGNEESVSG